MRSRIDRREILLIALITLTAATVQVLLLPTHFAGPDIRKYLEIAHGALEWRFWVSPEAFDRNYWPMGYPTFIASIWHLTGTESVRSVQFVQILLATSFVPLAWWISFSSGPRVRIWVAALVCFSPTTVILSQSGGYEVLIGWLLLVVVALIWRGGDSARITSRATSARAICIAAGVTLGAAFLVQNKVIVLVPVFVYMGYRWGRANLLLFCSGFAMPVIAWSIRNLFVLGSISPFSSNGAVNIWIGNNAASIAGEYMDPPASLGKDFVAQSIRFWIEQPEANVRLVLRKFARLLEPVYFYPERDLPNGVSPILHYLTAILSLGLVFLFVAYCFGALWRSHSIPSGIFPLALLWLLFLLVNLPFLAESRYRIPLEPLLICVAVPTLVALWRMLPQQFRRKRGTSVVFND